MPLKKACRPLGLFDWLMQIITCSCRTRRMCSAKCALSSAICPKKTLTPESPNRTYTGPVLHLSENGVNQDLASKGPQYKVVGETSRFSIEPNWAWRFPELEDEATRSNLVYSRRPRMYIHGGQNGNPGPIGPTTLADLFKIGCDYYGCKFMRGSRSARRASERSGLTIVPTSPKPSERSAQLPAQGITRTETPRIGCALRNAPILLVPNSPRSRRTLSVPGNAIRGTWRQ
jgi:hypothetical protein